MDEIARQRQFEDQFLSQIRARAATLTRGVLPADRVVVEHMPDGVDGVRAVLSRLEKYDRDLLHRLPGTQTVQLEFKRSVLGGLLRPTVSRIRAQTLTAVEALVSGASPGPIGREQLLDALARYEVLPRSERPTGVVFASPTGFTEDARALVRSYGPPTVILMGGRSDGGWDVTMPEAVRRSAWSKLFELETQDDLLNRLMHHLEQNADLVDSRGLSVAELADKLGLDRERTEELVRRACRSRSRLMTVVHDGQVHVCRTPLPEEGDSMSMWTRIRRLLRMKPTTAERVREMTAQRVRLEQQRREIDQGVAALEAQEVECVKKGAAATTAVERKQLAGRLVRVRRELGRARAQAAVLSRQIDIIGTQIHNLTLAERGRRIELPKAEELTKAAAEAEHVMAELSANAELAAGIEVTGEPEVMSETEEAILAEFEAAAQAESAAARRAEPEKPAAEPAPEAARGPVREAPTAARAAEPPREKSAARRSESAKPELG